MSQPGGHPDEPWEQRIRPKPRPVRPAAPVEPAPSPEPVPQAAMPLEELQSPSARPDRSRMDPSSLDWSAEHELTAEARQKNLAISRGLRARRIDRWLMTAILGLVLVMVGGGVYWFFKHHETPDPVPVIVKPATPAIPPVEDAGSRVLTMLNAFLTAPDAMAKTAHVLDRERVLPLMVTAYASGTLPEESLEIGVPQPLESGIMAVPARVSGPPDFVLHLMVREVAGSWKLDWETYEQEMTQRFTAFASVPGKKADTFRLVVERSHDFGSGPAESLSVRVAAPGAPAIAEPVGVPTVLAAALKEALPWNRRSRALVRLEWESASGRRPRLMLREVVRWEFLPP